MNREQFDLSAISTFIAGPGTGKKVLAVVVVFERSVESVHAWPLLCACLASREAGPAGGAGLSIYEVLIYDNSSRARARPAEGIKGCHYIHDAGNGGTAAAYRRAGALAASLGLDWLLLLDQDTLLPADFLVAADLALTRSACIPAALVPWVSHSGRMVSPARLTAFGSVVPLDHLPGMGRQPDLTAIASGSLMYVPTLNALMPIPERLWLDYVDHWIFAQFKRRQLGVVIVDTIISHNLSVFELGSLNPGRVGSILDGEALFVGSLGIRARLMFPLRLVLRSLRYLMVRPVLAWRVVAWAAGRMLASTQ